MQKGSIICILCPLGCKMSVEEKEGKEGELAVRGHQCRLGRQYAHDEFYCPTRILTSTVVVHGATLPRLPVKTDRPIPKEQVCAAAGALAAVEVHGPVRLGDVIIPNLLDTGANIIATRSLS